MLRPQRPPPRRMGRGGAYTQLSPTRRPQYISWPLGASGMLAYDSHRTVSRRKSVIQGLPPPGHSKRAAGPGAQSFCESGQLANHQRCGLRDRRLIKHESKSFRSPRLETLRGCIISRVPASPGQTRCRPVGLRSLWLLHRGHLEPGFGGQEDLYSWMSWTVTIRNSPWQAANPRALRGQWIESHPQSFCRRGWFGQAPRDHAR